MISSDAINDINSLQPDEQKIVFSLVKSFVKKNDYQTKAQKRFEEECAKYNECEMSMDEIDAIIHGV